MLCDLIPALPALILITAIAQRCKKFKVRIQGVHVHLPAGAHGRLQAAAAKGVCIAGLVQCDKILTKFQSVVFFA